MLVNPGKPGRFAGQLLWLALWLSLYAMAQTSGPDEWGAVTNGAHADCSDDTCSGLLSYFV